MSINAGPDMVTTGLVLSLDAANPASLSTSSLISVEVLVVAGGGAGGNGTGAGYESGGGGAGGLIYNPQFSVISETSYTVTVGAGGSARTGTSNGLNGENSIFGTLIAIGGGGGASSSGSSVGSAGGSGGGGSHAFGAGGAGTAGQGFAGAMAAQGSSGGGGGGGGGVGKSTAGNADGSGGPGLPFTISGSLQYYAGGGGGSRHTNVSGGIGGGGAGWGLVGYGDGTAGSPNTGGGGGGANQPGTNTGGGAGGSGVVIIRYYGLQKAVGGTITFADGYTIHTFTTSGTFVPVKSDKIWRDLSGFVNNGILVNGPGYSPEQGGCIVFNNIDNYVNIPQNSTINLSSTFTASVWVKITNLTDSHEIISKGNGLSGNGDFGWALSYYNVTNTIYFDTHSTSTRYALVASFNTTAWKNITVTFDNGTKFIYVDGVQLATASDAHTIGNTSYDFRISESSTWPALAGNVSCVTMYNRVLSAAEIQQNFSALRGRYGI